MPQPSFPITRLLLVLGVLLLLTLPMVVDLAVRGLHRRPLPPELHIPEGDVQRGRQAVVHYGCGACHTIPRVRRATGRVGPQLAGFREQVYIAGVMANTPDNLVAWLQRPQQINPQTAMPNLDVTERDARDMAAFLYSNP